MPRLQYNARILHYSTLHRWRWMFRQRSPGRHKCGRDLCIL